MDVDSPEGLLAEGAPKMEPLLWFSNTQSAHYHEMGGEKVRSIAFSPFCTVSMYIVCMYVHVCVCV